MRSAPRSGAPLVGRLMQSLSSLSASRYFPLSVAALAILLGLPSLGTGLILDDFYHREVLQPNSAYRELLGPPSEMFRFFRGDPARTGRIMDLGAFPWWTDPTLKAEFLQAVPTLTHRLDYALWPGSPALMHAQSLFWLATAVAAAAVFYRRMLGPTWVAAVAALLFAVDDARGTTVGFIANRNVLIAATFGFSALVCHDRWRRKVASVGVSIGAPDRAGAFLQGGRNRNVCVSRCVCSLYRPQGPLARLCGTGALRNCGVDLAHSSRLMGLRRSERGRLRRSADRPHSLPGRPRRARCP